MNIYRTIFISRQFLATQRRGRRVKKNTNKNEKNNRPAGPTSVIYGPVNARYPRSYLIHIDHALSFPPGVGRYESTGGW